MTVWQGASMHKTGPWSSDMPISLLFPLETGKFPEETTFVVFAMFFFCCFHHLLKLTSLLSLWIFQDHRSTWWQEDLSYDPAIFFICLLRQSTPKAWKRHFLHLQCGPVADQWRRFHLRLCIVTYLLLPADQVWHFSFFSRGDEMIWQCLQCFQNINWPLPCSSVFFSAAPLSGTISGWCIRQRTPKTFIWHGFSAHYRASASLLKSLFVILTWWKR